MRVYSIVTTNRIVTRDVRVRGLSDEGRRPRAPVDPGRRPRSVAVPRRRHLRRRPRGATATSPSPPARTAAWAPISRGWSCRSRSRNGTGGSRSTHSPTMPRSRSTSGASPGSTPCRWSGPLREIDVPRSEVPGRASVARRHLVGLGPARRHHPSRRRRRPVSSACSRSTRRRGSASCPTVRCWWRA